MSYQSASFIIFSAVALLLFYLVPKRAQKYMLLIANIFFYCYAGFQYVPFISVILFATYFAGRIMGRIYLTRSSLRRCYSGGKHPADATLHPVLLHHGRFCLCGRSADGQEHRCPEYNRTPAGHRFEPCWSHLKQI